MTPREHDIERDRAHTDARHEMPYLADNECEHGSLPTDKKIDCGCWRAKA